MHLSEAEYARLLARGQVRVLGERAPEPAPALSEDAFQRAVMRVAQDAGYTFAYHTYRSTKSMGGFPDLILAHKAPGHVCYAVELKTDTGEVSAAQQAWLNALAGSTGVVAEVWRPAMFSEIAAKLRG